MTELAPDDLVDRIYQAALNPEQWNSVLADVRESIGASAFSLFTLASYEGQEPELITCNIDPEWSQAYREFWWQHDQWVEGAVRKGLAVPGLTLSGSMLVDPNSFRKGAWFNEALRPQDIGDLLTTTLWTNDEPGPQLVLSFYRSPRSDGFGDAELKQLTLLSGHLRRAMGLSSISGQREYDLHLKDEILEGITTPLLILDGQRRISGMNASAADLLARLGETVIRIRGNRIIELGYRAKPSLDMAFFAATGQVGRAVSMAFVCRGLNAAEFTGSARLVRLQEPPRNVICRDHQERFMLTIHLSESPKYGRLQTFGALFGLTRAELRVLSLMIEDDSPRRIAQELGVSLPTVRTHLQKIRQKTGTRRFSDLLRLVIAASRNE